MLEKFFGRREHERTPIAQVTFDMARHSLKTKMADGREPISREGMYEAVKAGQQSGHYEIVTSQAEQGPLNIEGSPRERTAQSSVFRMLGEHLKDANLDNVDPEDIVRWLEAGDTLQRKETGLLNFQLGEGKYHQDIHQSVLEGRYFPWLVEHSDKMAVEEKQDPDKVTPLSIQASNVASFIASTGLSRTKELLDNNQNNPEIDFTTSHQGVLESFLYKVIDLKGDKKDVDEFLDKVGAGFAENEGLYLDFKRYGAADNDWQAVVRYGDKEYVLSPDDINKIIQDGENLKSQLKQQLEG